VKLKNTGFKAYFPDDDEGPEDARDIRVYDWQKVFDADDAAEHACEYDFGERDGWERGMQGGQTAEFVIVIIDPSGNETRYRCWHEASVEHNARRIDGDEDRQRLQAGEEQGRQDSAGGGQQGADGQAGCLDPAQG
jgi:hypothetical protein